jgi:hypothetical protein
LLSVTTSRAPDVVNVVKPLIVGWEPADGDSLCACQLDFRDLDGIDLVEAAPWNQATGDSLILEEAKKTRSGVRIAFHKFDYYPGIEGVVFGLLRDATKQYPLAFQMKCWSNASNSVLCDWANNAHKQMKNLGFCEGEYYVLLCVTLPLPPAIPGLPKGTMIVGGTFLAALCRPFGLGSAVMETIRQKEAASKRKLGLE